MSVTVYSITNCPKCAALKALLKRKNIAFQEFNVTENEEKKQELLQKTQQAGLPAEDVMLPVLDIDGKLVQGFDREEIEAELKEKGLSN